MRSLLQAGGLALAAGCGSASGNDAGSGSTKGCGARVVIQFFVACSNVVP